MSTHVKSTVFPLKSFLIERLRVIRRLGGSLSSAFRKLQFWVRFPAGVQKTIYTTMTNAPENPQTTRLSTTQPSNIADALYTPRELCMKCYNWLTPEDDLPHCLENAYDCRAYLLGTHDNCPKHIVL